MWKYRVFFQISTQTLYTSKHHMFFVCGIFYFWDIEPVSYGVSILHTRRKKVASQPRVAPRAIDDAPAKRGLSRSECINRETDYKQAPATWQLIAVLGTKRSPRRTMTEIASTSPLPRPRPPTSFGLPVRDGIQTVAQPYVEFEMTSGRERAAFKTHASKFPSGKNANFVERKVAAVLLPNNPLFAPQLCIRVRVLLAVGGRCTARRVEHRGLG